jgi:hypothetical protein
MATGGHITLNGVTDAELILILQAKEKDRTMSFNPQTMQPVQENRGGQVVTSVYNNVTLAWGNAAALRFIIELLQQIAPKA